MSAKRPVPLAEILNDVAPPGGRSLPSWLEQRAPVKPRPLVRAPSQQAAPVQPAEDIIRAEMEKRIEEAKSVAELEGLRSAETRVTLVVERYLDGARRLSEVAREARRPNAAEVVDLALTVAREIIGRECALDRDRVVAAIDEALAGVTVDPSLTIRISPPDMAYVRKRRPDLIAAGVTFAEDAGLHIGDYILETPQMVIDGAQAARLEAVRAALVTMVADAGTTPAGGAEDDAHEEGA